MTPTALRMCFGDRAVLERELETNLKLGRAFVSGAHDIEVLADCTLVLVHPDDNMELMLAGQAVFVSEAGAAMSGVGVQLRPFDADVVGTIEAFVRGERAADAAEEPEAAAADTSVAATVADDDDTAGEAEHAEDAADASSTDAAAAAEGHEAADEDTQNTAAPADVQKQEARHERLRKLNQTQQHKMARIGDLQDRVMLERLYGKNVWDSLLHNPKLTLPEVASIARKGTIPRPLLELIVENNAWIQAPIVRRALLGNPRISGEAIMKLLRITPKQELKVIHKTTTYSTQVREAARKVLDL